MFCSFWFWCVLSLSFRWPRQPGYVTSGVIACFSPLAYKWPVPILHPVSQHRTKIEETPLPSPLFLCHSALCDWWESFWCAVLHTFKDFFLWYLHILTTRRMLSPFNAVKIHTFLSLNDLSSVNRVYFPPVSHVFCPRLLVWWLLLLSVFLPFLRSLTILTKTVMKRWRSQVF